MMKLNDHRFTKVDRSLELFHQVGLFDVIRKLTPNFLTVLNYHRIDDPYLAEFDTFRPNISATPSDFALQMDYISQNFNVISGVELVSFIKGKRKLPIRAALITFDDGYYDNYANAFPILKARGLPAIIFLTTDFIGTGKTFYWDLIAYCFHRTKLEKVELPYLGPQNLADESVRTKVMHHWIEVLKKLPKTEKQKIIDGLPEMMAVHVPDQAFRKIMMSWAHAREMSENGIEMGGHTVSHPILTRIPLEEASWELMNCKRQIEEQISGPVLSFAYPNGQAGDFSPEIMNRVQQAGFEVAFTLLPGPTQKAEVLRTPLAIRRIFLSHRDTFPRFVAKLAGIDRINPKSRF
jgi:peptidoglycan/xylan/chitin deacetylase (PgdA/CDA1 family)